MRPHIWYSSKYYSMGRWYCAFRRGTDYRCGVGSTPTEAYTDFNKAKQ